MSLFLYKSYFHLKYKCKRAVPIQALWAGGGSGSHISRQFALECNKEVSPKNRPPLLSRKYSWYSFLSPVASTAGP